MVVFKPRSLGLTSIALKLITNYARIIEAKRKAGEVMGKLSKRHKELISQVLTRLEEGRNELSKININKLEDVDIDRMLELFEEQNEVLDQIGLMIDTLSESQKENILNDLPELKRIVNVVSPAIQKR